MRRMNLIMGVGYHAGMAIFGMVITAGECLLQQPLVGHPRQAPSSCIQPAPAGTKTAPIVRAFFNIFILHCVRRNTAVRPPRYC